MLSILPLHTITIEERQVAQAISEHLAAALSRSGVAKVNLVTPAILHRPVIDRHYSLLGRLTLASGKVRLTIRLVSDVTGHHIWADSFDGVADAPFALQDRVAAGVVAAAFAPALISAEIEQVGAHCPGPYSRRAGDLHCPRAFRWRWRRMSTARSICWQRPERHSTPIPPTLWHYRWRRSVMHAGRQLFGHYRTGRESREQAIQLSRRAGGAKRSRRVEFDGSGGRRAADRLARPAEDIERLTAQGLGD